MTAHPQHQVTPTPASIDARVDQYVQIRDMIRDMEKKHEEAIKPYKDALEQLASVLLNHLNTTGLESARTASGTVYRSERVSATIQDVSAFWDHVVGSENWDLIDKRANKTAVSEYVKYYGNAPPGVNYTVSHVVGVRRA
jgi:hypothetical protein